MSNYKFFDDVFTKSCVLLIREDILPNLNEHEFNIIGSCYINIINFIALRFNFDKDAKQDYEYQLKQNGGRDAISIFNMILPYIDDKEGTYELHKQIYNIKDITIKKDKELEKGFVRKTENPNKDNITKNPYIISNLQFDRHILNKMYLESISTTATRIENKENIFGEDVPTYLQNNNRKDDAYFFEYEMTINDILSNYYILLNTIDQISNKLYINWINILPITENYKESRLYKNTFKYDETNKQIGYYRDNEFIKIGWHSPLLLDGTGETVQDYDKYSGLSCGDIYNMIHHELYYSVKQYKWLIYELPLNYTEQSMYIYWDIISKQIFPRIETYILNNVEYDEITEKWEYNKNDINVQDAIMYDIIFNIIYFLQRKYSNKSELVKDNFIQLNIETTITDDDILLEILDDELGEQIDTNEYKNKIKKEDVIISWNSLSMKHIYNYMKETILEFKKTWYGNNILIKKNNYPSLEMFDYKITYKNIYNWAKSILIETYRDSSNPIKIKNLVFFQEYNWSCLGYVDEEIEINDKIKRVIQNDRKNRFIDAIRKTEKNNWFNIKGLLRRKMNMRESNINKLNGEIYKTIKKNIIDICFECLFNKGMLNEFKLNRTCTDNVILSNDYDIKKQNRYIGLNNTVFNKQNIEQFNKCIYYLTNEPYANLPVIIRKNEKNKTYFESLKTEAWMTFYALDWVSQINFFHRYINNRVLYITGAPGQGKSTQIPKLLLYGLRMIYFKNNGKVISTQPRTLPTINNAERISTEMGVPIKTYSKIHNTDIKTYMGYIQYNTMKNHHLIKNDNFYIKEMTDGKFFQELLTNPLLKMPIIENTDLNYNYKIQYSKYNLYDIIVIDESHEHNKNMDYILTMMKNSLQMNKSIKLIIVSATMEADDEKYRSFYRSINDNHMFPPSYYNNCSFFDNQTTPVNIHNYHISLDRITVDRRIHISPPKETNQFTIDDHYLEIDTISYDDAEEQGIKKMKELLSMNVKGDIVFFTTGTAQIKKLCTLFNSITASHIIALPLYGELDEYWQNLIKDTKNIKLFDIHKQDIFTEINQRGSGRKVSIGTYSQVILVSTNIAEASLTIDGLTYIIDTGYQYTIEYNNIDKLTTVNLTKITESSRKQRRGRVGRTANGTIYYMYAKNSRLDIKQQYSICTSNIVNDIFKLMRKNYDESILINNKFNSHLIYTPNSALNMSYELKNDNLTIDTIIIKNMLHSFYKYDKMVLKDNMDNSIIDLMHYQNLSHSLHNSSSNILFKYDGNPFFIYYNTIFNTYLFHDRFETGYSLNTLLDIAGTFYLIHPSENDTIRHIMTRIIDPIHNYNHFNTIVPFQKYILKMYNYVDTLFFNRMIIPTHPISQSFSLNEWNNETDKLNFTKYLVYCSSININSNRYSNMSSGLYYIYPLFTDKTNNYNDCFNKTELSNRFEHFINKLDITDTIKDKDDSLRLACLTSCIYAELYGVLDEVLMIVSLIFTYGIDMSNLIQKKQDRVDISFTAGKHPLEQFKHIDGDLLTLLNIFKTFITDTSILDNIIKYNNTTNIQSQYKQDSLKYQSFKKTFQQSMSSTVSNIFDDKFQQSKLTLSDFILLQKQDQRFGLDNIKSEKEYSIDKKSQLSNIISVGYDKIIVMWAVNRHIDAPKLFNTLKMYLKLKDKFEQNLSELEWMRDNIYIKKEITMEENILKSFFHSFVINMSYYNSKSHKLISMLYATQQYIPKSIFPGSPILDTTISLFNTIFFMKKDIYDSKQLVINLNKFNIKWLIDVFPDIISIEKLTTNMMYDTSNNLYNLLNIVPISYIEKQLKYNKLNKSNKSNDKPNNLINYYRLFL